MNHYAALDVSLRSIHICVMDENGSIKAEGQTPSEVEDIIEFINSLDVEVNSIGFEAGTLTQCLSDDLQSAGFDVICMEAGQLKAALSTTCNEEERDARKRSRNYLSRELVTLAATAESYAFARKSYPKLVPLLIR